MNLPDDFAWIAESKAIGGDGFRDDASGSDHRVVADIDAGQKDGTSPYPDIIAYSDGGCLRFAKRETASRCLSEALGGF